MRVSSLHGFMKGNTCLPKAITFCVEMMGVTDEAEYVCLYFSKAVDTAGLERCSLNRQNCLDPP